MKLDVDSLGTFYEMAREGAGLAASRLTAMTDIDTRVGVTRLNFTDLATIRAELDDGEQKLGISTELSGGLEGTSFMLFTEESAADVTQTILGDLPETAEFDTAMNQSAIVEVGQIMNSGFVDGWADVLDTKIDVDPPTYVAGTDPDQLVGETDLSESHEELALVFRSQIETVGTEIDFQHYLIPTHTSMARLFERQPGERGIEHSKLAGFDRMANQGAATVADNLTQMTNIDMEVDIRRINFVSLDAIPEEVSNERLVSIAFSFDGMPSGFMLFLFDEPSAQKLVEATVGETLEDGFSDMGADAVQELSNIMASGMLDGWANVLSTVIDHSPPAYTYDMGAATVDPLIVGLSDTQEFAFMFDTRVKATDTSFDVEIFAIPDEDDLEEALETLDTSLVEDTPTTAEFSVDELDDDVAVEDDIGSIGEVETQ